MPFLVLSVCTFCLQRSHVENLMNDKQGITDSTKPDVQQQSSSLITTTDSTKPDVQQQSSSPITTTDSTKPDVQQQSSSPIATTDSTKPDVQQQSSSPIITTDSTKPDVQQQSSSSVMATNEPITNEHETSAIGSTKNGQHIDTSVDVSTIHKSHAHDETGIVMSSAPEALSHNVSIVVELAEVSTFFKYLDFEYLNCLVEMCETPGGCIISVISCKLSVSA